ncbi:hypothetical protein [Shewanella dokdonensis]|uniref:hypothetical protein n=1 Tax=Shewanella dokdonensis TaxID=712036 RepID=UPI003CC7E1A5
MALFILALLSLIALSVWLYLRHQQKRRQQACQSSAATLVTVGQRRSATDAATQCATQALRHQLWWPRASC